MVIVGAGVGGLAAAIHLAARGCRVTLLERNERVGGKLNLIEAEGGWRFDTGPSLLTMPDVARELFAVAGASLDEEIELMPLDPICRYVFPDGITFDACADDERMAASIEEFSHHDALSFTRFLDHGRRVYDLTAGPFLYAPLGTRGQMARQLARRLNHPLDLARVLAPISLDRLVRSYFRDPHIVRIFDRYATYNGSSPYRLPALYALIPYVERHFGAWYPRGGMYQIAEKLARLACGLGVTLRAGAPVAGIVCPGRRAAGVRLVDGEVILADAVISNVDVATTYRHLVPATERDFGEMARINALEPSLSGFVLMLGVDRRYDQLAHHNVYFSHDYHKEFEDLLTRKVPPDDPTIYVCATTRTEPGQAPAGCENLFVLVSAPPLSAEFDWGVSREGYRDLVLDKLERMGLEGLRRHIVVERSLTPDDFATRYGAQRGAIYGFSSNGRFAPFTRPGNRARDIDRLYFVGGSTHPGGGLPLVMLSGKITSELVCADLGI